MKAADVMTRDVVTIDPEATVLAAVRLMLKERISGLPVVDAQERLVGIITEGDFLRRVETGTEKRRGNWLEALLGPGHMADEYVRTHARTVGEVMSTDTITVPESAALDEIVQLMEKRRIKRVPVVRDGKVVGIVSRANLMRALASAMADLPEAEASDAQIRERFLAEMRTQKWAPRASIDATVRSGALQLWGSIFDERERKAIVVAAENIPGVKSVVDNLVWVAPVAGMIVEPPEDAHQGKVQRK